jgi:Arc/MetJ-type ribon-helix-helix transcriptional regulator
LRTKKYTNVALPTELVEAVRNEVNESHAFYTSMADFVKEALREKLERIAVSKRASPRTHDGTQ